MHHTTSVHHTSYAHTLTSSAATTSDAPMSINDAAAKKCRFMMIVCWLMFIDVSSKIFYETANYPALERVIGEWNSLLDRNRVLSLNYWAPNMNAWRFTEIKVHSVSTFQTRRLGGWTRGQLCVKVSQRISPTQTVPDFNCPLVLKFLLFTTERGTRVRKVRPQQKSKYL